MKPWAPFILITLAVVTFILLVVGNDSYSRIAVLKSTLDQQRSRNLELRDETQSLRSELYGLQHDKRALEKEARNQLGMARPDELIYFFED
ncbi:MAG: septum formation initiator family protein [Deltaproteobacteria bacterium]|nr:septum formation initiator family protein [Deltaproteobacteria bacterium]